MQPYQHTQNVNGKRLKRMRELAEKYKNKDFDPYNGRAGRVRIRGGNTTPFGSPFVHEGL